MRCRPPNALLPSFACLLLQASGQASLDTEGRRKLRDSPMEMPLALLPLRRFFTDPLPDSLERYLGLLTDLGDVGPADVHANGMLVARVTTGEVVRRDPHPLDPDENPFRALAGEAPEVEVTVFATHPAGIEFPETAPLNVPATPAAVVENTLRRERETLVGVDQETSSFVAEAVISTPSSQALHLLEGGEGHRAEERTDQPDPFPNEVEPVVVRERRRAEENAYVSQSGRPVGRTHLELLAKV